MNRTHLFATTALMTGLVVSASAFAQAPAAPAAPKAAPTAPAMPTVEFKRTADGRPDLGGSWMTYNPMLASLLGGLLAPAKDAKPNELCVVGCNSKPGDAAPGFALRPDGKEPEVPAAMQAMIERPTYKPEYVAKVQQLDKEQVSNDTVLLCQNPGVPRLGPPHKIIQTPTEITFLYSDLNGSFWRLVPITDKHNADADISMMGDSIGRWEGDTLVVETVNLSDVSWMIDDGAFHTEALKVTEKLTPTPQGIRYEVTADDPAVLAQPWVKRPRNLIPARAPITHQVPCVESSIQHMTTKEFSHDNAR